MNKELNQCVVCEKPQALVLRTVIGPRSKKEMNQYLCLSCHSLFNPSGYEEDDATLKKDLEWNLGVTARNELNSRKLIRRLDALYPLSKKFVEIGCGTGTTLRIAQNEFNKVIEGYDVRKCLKTQEMR